MKKLIILILFVIFTSCGPKKKADEIAREYAKEKREKDFNEMSLENYLNNKYEGENENTRP